MKAHKERRNCSELNWTDMV